MQSWNVCAPPMPSVPARERAARDRSGSARRRRRNTGAGNDGGEQEEGTTLDTA